MLAYEEGKFRRIESFDDARPGEKTFIDDGVLLDVLEQIATEIVEQAAGEVLAAD